jgi:hypothetical protein
MLLKKTGTAETSRCIMQVLLSSRKTPNPAPQPNNNFRQLPRAEALERISHGVTQLKMLTNFHTLLHENKWRQVCVHCHKSFQNHLQQINQKNQNSQKYNNKNSTTSIIHYSRNM